MEFYLDLGMTRSDTQRSPVSSRRFWRRTGCLVLVLLFLGVLVWLLAVGGASGRQSSSTRADIVFVIDATGSMHDEISDVKTSLMSIGNLLANKKPEPDVRFGAVFYRDITDEEIVRVVPLSRDLASVREAIMNVRADGGGDWPEHVGIGLHEALEMDWSHTQNGGVRLVYLVGDAPPKHYSDGYGVDRALDLANDLGVKVHVIGCSGLGNGREEMERIATYTGGVYTEFERQEGGQHMSSKGRYSERTEMAAALRHIIAYSSSVDVMPDSMDVRLESPASVKTDSPVIGIDIGTSYGVVGIFKHGSVEIIPNAEGQRKTPAFVAFSGNETLVGDSAKHYAAKDPSQAFSGLRRIIGRRFSDPVVQEEMEALPYGLVEVKGKPSIRATESGVAKDLPIEKVMAVIIAELRNSAENYLGQEVHNAVLTVPAYFSDAQRQATKEAGVIAGLNVLIINEPTAAAIAYGLDKKTEGNIIVYDLGGGTLDISALTIDSGVFEVLSTAGDTHLGGDDFDRRILQHFVEDIQAKHGLNMSREEHSSALERLRQASEIARHDLSVSQETTVSIDGLISGIAYSTTITKSLFENITWDLLERAREPLVRVVNESGLMPAQFDHILLTGGATRMPQIKALVNSFFSRDHLSDSVNPDEAVAYGAAVVAGSFSAKHGSDLLLLDSSDLLLLDVTPMTLGFTLASSPTEVVPMISRNTVVPTRKTMIVSTAADNQLEISFKIYEGEQPLAEDNRLLGEFHLGGIAPAPKGQPQIEVVFEVDSNGILSVSAQDMHSGKTEKTTITQDKGRLSEDDSEIMVKDVEGYADRDSILRQRIKARERIEAFMETLRHAMNVNESMKMLDAEQEVRIAETLANHTLWLSSNPNASEIDAKHEELEKENAPFIQQSRALEQSKNAKHMFNEFLRVVDLVSSSSDFKFGDEDQMRIRDALSRGLAWIASHPDAKSEAIKAAHREIEIEIITVTSKYHSHHSGDFSDDLPIKSLDDRSDELTLGEAEELHKMGRLSKMMFFSMEAEL